MQNNDTFLNTLYKAAVPDLVETLSMCVNPGEADMLLTIALHKHFNGKIPEKYLANRFLYHQPWAFFDRIFLMLTDEAALAEKLSYSIISLYEENPYTLSCDDDVKSSPYHPYLEKLPALYTQNGHCISLKDAEFCGLIPKAANLEKDYRQFTSDQELTNEFKALNHRDQPSIARDCRINALTEIRYIKNHPFFPKLNGQRGVFAKTFIPSGTVIGYVSGDMRKIGDPTPPVLCSWPIAQYRFKFSFSLARNFVHTYTQWVDSYILGNRLKLINSCVPETTGYKPIKQQEAPYIGNIGCYFGHFRLTNDKIKYITIPFYISLRDITPGEELMTFYGCKNY